MKVFDITDGGYCPVAVDLCSQTDMEAAFNHLSRLMMQFGVAVVLQKMTPHGVLCDIYSTVYGHRVWRIEQ